MALPFNITGTQIASHIGFGLLLLGLLHITRPAYLAFRRRRAGFGVVFDSVTGLPVDRVTVSLRDLHGQIVRTVVTEKDGRYRLLAPKGEYYFEVTKPNYSFPSIHFKNKRESTLYNNLLSTEHIVIKDHGVLTKNIAIDHVDKQGQKTSLKYDVLLSKGVQTTIAIFSPLLAFTISFFGNSWLIRGMFACYLIAMANRLFSFTPPQPPYGTIRDAETGEQLAGVVVRILNSKTNKILETQVTSPKGRYAFIVNKGAYRILITKRGYKGVVLNFPAIKEDRFLMSKDVRMKQMATRITPLSENMRGTLEPMPEAQADISGQMGDFS